MYTHTISIYLQKDVHMYIQKLHIVYIYSCVYDKPGACQGFLATEDELLNSAVHWHGDDLAGQLLVLLGFLHHPLQRLSSIEAVLLLGLLAMALGTHEVAVALEVVLAASGIVRQQLVCVLDLHEDGSSFILLLLCLIGLLVRVVVERQLSVGLLDFVVGGILLKSQSFVVVDGFVILEGLRGFEIGVFGTEARVRLCALLVPLTELLPRFLIKLPHSLHEGALLKSTLEAQD